MIEKRQVSGYLLIIALVMFVMLIFIYAFKSPDSSGKQVTIEKPKNFGSENTKPKQIPEKEQGQDLPWEGIM
ncbi:MAG: hypothetical protein ACUVUU_07355 [bacterium]